MKKTAFRLSLLLLTLALLFSLCACQTPAVPNPAETDPSFVTDPATDPATDPVTDPEVDTTDEPFVDTTVDDTVDDIF